MIQFSVNGESLYDIWTERVLLRALRVRSFEERRKKMSILKGKKVVIIGDRDGIPGPAIQACVESASGEVVFASTECFV